MGYLAAVDDLPIMEAVRRNQAAPVLEGGAIGGLLGHRLDSGINRGILGLRLLRPMRDQTPLCHHHFPVGVRIPDNRNLLRGGDVVAGLQADRLRVIQVECFPDSGVCRVKRPHMEKHGTAVSDIPDAFPGVRSIVLVPVCSYTGAAGLV